MKNAPHLPPKSCSIKAKHNWHVLKWAISVISLALIAGVAASFIAFSWLWPLTSTDGYYLVNYSQKEDEQLLQDPMLVRHVRQRTVSLYDSSEFSQSGIYPKQAKIGNSILLSSDGWSVMPSKLLLQKNTKNLVGIDDRGAQKKVEEILNDKINGFSYIKFSGSDFRVTSFAKWDEIKSGYNAWAINGVWKSVKLDKYQTKEVGDYSLIGAEDLYSLDSISEDQNLVINSKGDFLGFIEGGYLKLVWSVEKQLPFILENGILPKNTFDLKGHFIDGWVDQETEVWNKQTGFYVASVTAKSGFEKGDIILQLDGTAITEVDFMRLVSLSADSFEVQILRAGELMDLKINK